MQPAPEPGRAPKAALQLAYVPALAVELTVDNRTGKGARRVIFGLQDNDSGRGVHLLDETSHGRFAGIACGDSLAIASGSPGVFSAQGFTPDDILAEEHRENYAFALGACGLLIGTIPPKRRVTLRFAICFHRGGVVTTGMESRYYYTRFFSNLTAVAAFTLRHFDAVKRRGANFEKRFRKARLNIHRRFMLSHAIHSYYGSTELLEVNKRPLWIVNEGEYRMMNTFDLTVDQVFFEMDLNPWTVRNELDWFVKRYAYIDRVRLPGEEADHPGGLSFTHDMGVINHFSRPGHSAYEKTGLDGCFSHMTHEELVNWIICGLLYEHQTRDSAWLRKALPTFQRALTSLLNRDHPRAERRDGIMSLDSSRCKGGSEITTYDSLDVSLGQARNNLYLGVKCWGCYVGLEALFKKLGDAKRALICRDQAGRAAATIAASADNQGLLPAVLHENVMSRIIPAIEGLIIPHQLGLSPALSEQGEYGALVRCLKRHLAGVLKPGVCLFDNGAWKISSTSDNSWLSKIYLCQFIAEKVLGSVSAKEMENADQAHAAWLLSEKNNYWAWSDQMLAGTARGSKFYPRGVTSILWI